MKIAITGATGFIGRHVLTELARHDVEVIAISRHAATAPGTNGVELNIQAATNDAFERIGRPDALIHLAWGGLPNYRSLHHFEQELPAHYRFLNNLIASGLNNLMVVGTCFEYGMQSGPLSEDLPARPDNPYGYAKDSLRRQLEYLRAAHPFNLTWARLFYLHGEGQAKNSLFPLLSQAVARGDKVFNMSGGEQLRDYLPVTEVARCLVALALKRADPGVVNLCSGRPISVRRLVEGWIAENNWSIELNLGHYPYPDYEPMAFWGDRRKLDSLLETR
jgi:dTDP-6-deoxy-L-talose 4-dehydrogenase (NAD+)